MDSTRLLTEKLTLARELASLKPEFDHLRSQVASHQTLLAEKLSLQRQVSTLQVEQETEKRACQRALAKDGKSLVEDAKWESRAETLQADLAKERRERQKIEREAQNMSTELENHTTTLESRLDAFRSKLKTTKEQLKETQTALQKSEASAQAASSRAMAAANPAKPVTKYPRKRATVDMDAHTMIDTPGDLRPAKRIKKSITQPGEKSMFSVTPFLNRITNMAPGNPAMGDGDAERQHSEEPAIRLGRCSKTKRIASESGSADESKSSDLSVNTLSTLETAQAGKARPPLARNQNAALLLNEVVEEDRDGNFTTSFPKSTASQRFSDQGVETKKKKRRLLGGGLGKTLFDEDDGNATNAENGMMGGARGFGTLPGGRIRGLKLLPRKVYGASSSEFGAMSPLKKNRKAM